MANDMSPGAIQADQGMQGADGSGIGRPQPQPASRGLMDYLLQSNPLSQVHTFFSDTFRTIGAVKGRPDYSSPLQLGRIVHTIPFLCWHKVQLDRGGGPIGCVALGDNQSCFGNIGVRPISPVGPGAVVLVWVPPGENTGLIIGVLPEAITQGVVNICTWLMQGGNSGTKREAAHMYPIKKMFREGGVRDFSDRRPVDATSNEWGHISESGIGILIDSFQAFFRVSEACGLFLNYWDNHMRQAALNYDFQSSGRQISIREDEGENLVIQSDIVYPWEAVGMYTSGEEWTGELTDKAVHYDDVYGKIDMPKGDEDRQPVYRFVEYGGYLGQPRMRMLMAPEKSTGKRAYKDQPFDRGLWQESVSLDGTYSMRSAKSMYFGHRVMIPVPKRLRLPEDQKTGDDARQDNYKFSSKFGSGEEHKVSDVTIEGDEKHLRRVAGVLDILTYTYNWKTLHPFHYHKQDYKLYQESQLKSQPFYAALDKLNFGTLATKEFMDYPTPVKLHIDHRYGDVEYFQRESFFAFHEDGSLSIGCGYGAQIAFVGGQIQITAPGDIQLISGKRVVTMGWDVVTRAKNSVDISATNKDVRIKSEKNMQLIAGNGGEGGMLLECKSSDNSHSFDNVFGEAVEDNGITLVAKRSQVGVLGNDIYMRTGVTTTGGNIVLDASQGDAEVVMYGFNASLFLRNAFQIWHPPFDAAAHLFSANRSIITSAETVIRGSVAMTKGSLTVNGVIGAEGRIVSKSAVGQPGGGFLFDSSKWNLKPFIDPPETRRRAFVKKGKSTFETILEEPLYTPPTALGNDRCQEVIGFSFRDPLGSTEQYKTENFKFAEPRWQQLAATYTLGTGGESWTETPVMNNGRKTYPWPGKKKWLDEPTLQHYGTHTIFDESAACAKDRPYDDPKLGAWDPKVPDGNFKTIF